MKRRFLLSVLTPLMIGTAAGAAVPDLNCANQMYRDSELQMNPQGRVVLQDSYVGPLDALVEHLAQKHNLPLAHQVSGVRLSVNADEMTCHTLGRYPMACQIRAGAPGQLLLTLSFGENALRGSITLNLPVKVRAFTINSHLSSPGPISLGSQPVTVGLKNLVVEARAELEYEGVSAQATWNTFFHTDAPTSHSASWCY